MAEAIRVPDLGTNVDEVLLVAWLVEEGESVERGASIAEIETDKAVTELESHAEGVLLRHAAAEGETVATGQLLAWVGEAGEEVSEAEATLKHEKEGAEYAARPEPATARPAVSPVVRNLAEKRGVDLSQIRGTGREGTVTRADVLRAAEEGASAAGRELSPPQRAVARAVTRSVREMPHLRINAALDMAAAQWAIEQGRRRDEGIGYDAIFVKALAAALREVPAMAARLEDDRIVRPDGFHVAVAVDRGQGLFLPVVRDADQKDLRALHREIKDFAERSGRGAIQPREMTGGCTALSNLGMYPVDSFEAIIFPEHSSVLAVGAVRSRPVAVEGHVEVRAVAEVNLAADHRLINGRTAAEFVAALKRIVESGDFD